MFRIKLFDNMSFLFIGFCIQICCQIILCVSGSEDMTSRTRKNLISRGKKGAGLRRTPTTLAIRVDYVRVV